MIQIIVNAFVEESKETAVVEVLFASADHEKVKAKYQELKIQYPDNYLAIYDLPLDTDLSSLSHYPSVAISKEELN
ncbi:phosphoribosylaminoimidazole carboxylase [Streptococcus cristatus]|uniref:phosphoribosylaminoimidazole carboxylase n=1 Tax=Streptococcus cristatus TaxID=45634 RepID=UPI0039C078AC